MSALVFALLALCLVGPVPALLARASWPLRAPRAALVLWQSIAAAAVLSAMSAGLALASGMIVAGPDGPARPLWSVHVIVLMLTAVIGVRLVVAVMSVSVATRRRRARHRTLVDLLGVCHGGTAGRSSAGGGALRVLDVEQPLAYCLPGVRSRVVVSEGALATLGDREVTAILAHERAHLRARHDLVIEAFTAVHAAFPRFVRSASALDEVRLLTELLADDAAVRTTGPAPLARALVACAAGRTPSGALAVGGPTTVLRVRRLAGRPNSAMLATAGYLGAAAVLVLPTVAVAVPWLAELRQLILMSR